MSVEKIKEWTLKVLAAEAGVPERTIRFYISRGLVDPPLRGGRGAAYGTKHKERLELIRAMQAQGMMLAEISQALSMEEGRIPDRPVHRLEEHDTRKMLWFEKDGTLDESQRHLLAQEHQLAALAAPALPEPEIWRSYAVAPDVRVMFMTGASPWRTKAVLAALRRFAVEVTQSTAKGDKSE
jgi:DNA-binding transcriptional MerR regulator